MSSPPNRLERLPTLVQEEIIVQLGTEPSLESLFQACPTMRSIFDRYETRIRHRILRNLIVDDEEENIVKDVFAITRDIPRGKWYLCPVNSRLRIRSMTSHRRGGTLKSPIVLSHLRSVHRMVSRSITFIEDYVSKATSGYPPRAYLGLPDLKWGTGSKFRGRQLDTKLVSFTSLKRPEKYRLLRAYVRFELVCLIYRIAGRWSDPSYDQLVKDFNDFGGSNAPDILTFYSAHDYYKTVYGAVFAHCGDAWLPNTTRDGRELMFPDSLFFDAHEYFKDLNLGTKRRPQILDELAGRGLDLLSGIISNLNKADSWKHYFKTWLRDLIDKTQVFRPWILIQDRFENERLRDALLGSYWEDLLGRHPQSATIFFGTVVRLHSLRSGYFKLWQKPFMRQVQIYRQRAWGLFDDQRLYPKSSQHFPEVEELAALDLPASPYYKEARKYRRSQRWQDFWAERRSVMPDATERGIYAPRIQSRFFDERMDDRLPEIWSNN